MKRRHPQAGFSLIEILLVLGIITFIAAMVANNVFQNTEKAKLKQAMLGVKKLASEVQAYYLDNNSLPSKIEDLVVKPANAQNWRQYAQKSQMTDPWGNPFVLKVDPQSAQGFAVISFGADKAEGGSDLNTDISSAE
jgi:general secretion pathway protein G